MTEHSWIHFFISVFFVSLPWSFHPERSSSDLCHIWSPRKMKRLRTRKQKSGEKSYLPLQSAVMWPSRQQCNNSIPFHQNRISLKSKSDFWAQHSWQQTLYFVRQLLTVSLGAWREGGADWDNYKWISVHNHPRWRQLNHLLPQSSSMYLPDL